MYFSKNKFHHHPITAYNSAMGGPILTCNTAMDSWEKVVSQKWPLKCSQDAPMGANCEKRINFMDVKHFEISVLSCVLQSLLHFFGVLDKG